MGREWFGKGPVSHALIWVLIVSGRGHAVTAEVVYQLELPSASVFLKADLRGGERKKRKKVYISRLKIFELEFSFVQLAILRCYFTYKQTQFTRLCLACFLECSNDSAVNRFI